MSRKRKYDGDFKPRPSGRSIATTHTASATSSGTSCSKVPHTNIPRDANVCKKRAQKRKKTKTTLLYFTKSPIPIQLPAIDII